MNAIQRVKNFLGYGEKLPVKYKDSQYVSRSANSASPYEGATMGRRTGSWTPTRDAVNSTWWSSADMLVARSRDIVRKDSWAAKTVDEWVSNAIGTGIKPQSNHPNEKIRAKLQKLWDLHVAECDYDGTTDMYGLQALAFRSMVEGGECFNRRHTVDDDPNLLLPLQYQLIESEQCPYYLSRSVEGTPEGNSVIAGIEKDTRNRRSAYYFYKAHPGERIFMVNAMEVSRVEASDVMHLFRPLRPGQMRGIPWLSNALIRLWELDQYDDAELLRKKFAAMLMAFITSTSPEDNKFPGSVDAVTDVSGAMAIQQLGNPLQGVQEAALEAGTMMDLAPGEDVKFTDPADVGGNYEAFERQMLLRISAGVGLPYYMMTGDLSQASYGSLRAGMLSFRRLCEQVQFGCFIFKFCRPSWKNMLDAAVLAGEISAKDYRLNKTDYLDVSWRTPRFDWIDPEKDLKAEILAVRAGFKARSQAIHEQGEDPERVRAQIQTDNKEADEDGAIYDSDPRRTDQKGVLKVEKESGEEPQNSEEVIQK